MLEQLSLKNFTVFEEADLRFSPGLNVVIGENGTGKSHLLKLAFALAFTSAEAGKDENRQTKTWMAKAVAEKLVSTYRPDSLGRLVRRAPHRQRLEVIANFRERPKSPNHSSLAFSFATNSKTDVSISQSLQWFENQAPIFFPTREVISIFPGFAALYRERYLEFDETFYDLCLALEHPILKGPKFEDARPLITMLEEAIQGRVVVDNRRFYLKMPGKGNMEMPLVAEGIRKVAMLAYLINNGSLRDRGMLFWDEPETNLNPHLVRLVAEVILLLGLGGIQVFIATHSLFLLRELEILSRKKQFKTLRSRFFALEKNDGEVGLQQGDSIDDVDPIASLDESLKQSDRFMDEA